MKKQECEKISFLRRRFLVGDKESLPLEIYPENWQLLLRNQSPQAIQPMALALLSHYQMLNEPAQSPKHLEAVPILPPLALPPVPKKYFPILKSALAFAAEFPHYAGQHNILYFLQTHGYSLPPHFGHYMPKKREENLPPLYDLWISYLGGEKEDSQLQE